jgi:nucleotide-binding universal stress UspA family protein
MRALIWITENTWEGSIDHARVLLPDNADVTLLHVASSDVEEMAVGGGPGRLGRHRRPPPGPPVREIAAEEAQALLGAARVRLGRPAEVSARRGRVEREVLEACDGADLLIVARDGETRLGPKSLGPRTRFVADHARCPVLIVWAGEAPGAETMRWPPHLR